MGNNETTVASVSTLAPLAVIAESVVSYFLPDFYSHMPAGTITGAFLALAAWLTPPVHTIFEKMLGTEV
jgi:hypothetical protein